MPWLRKSVMELKKEFVELAKQPGINFRLLCQRFGISSGTGYKWRNRYLVEGEAGLQERSRRPRHSPARRDTVLETRIAEAARQWPFWGARKLKAWLERQGQPMPAVSTVDAALRRQGLRPLSQTPPQSTGRFEYEQPNPLWQMDFKGHFETGFGRCHPLTLLDDHSRYLLCLASCTDETRQTVQARLAETFTRYGLPDQMTMDNGTPWGNAEGHWTGLELWLMRQGIRVGHSRPYHPQTQGKLERLHATLKHELLQGRYFAQQDQVEFAFDRWRQDYNQERPHEALAQQPPITRYRPSRRSYNPHPAPPEYDEAMRVRRVDSSGKLSFKHNRFKIGKAFIRETLGVREEQEEGVYSLWWYSTRIGSLDLKRHAAQLGKRH